MNDLTNDLTNNLTSEQQRHHDAMTDHIGTSSCPYATYDPNDGCYGRCCRTDYYSDVHGTLPFMPRRDITSKPYYGFELEYEYDDSSEASCMELQNQYVYACQVANQASDSNNPEPRFLTWHGSDGSLNHGFEVRHVPATMSWYKDHMTQLNVLRDRFAEYAIPESTCGMHVHISRTAWTNGQILMLIKFFLRNEDELIRYSGRDESAVDEWCPFHDNLEHDFVQDGDTPKYCVVHVSHKTIEIRLFGAPQTNNKFWANMELCEALYHYTQNEERDLEWNSFMSFVNRGDYKYLLQQLKRCELCV